MYPFLCIAFGVQTLPVCHERSTIIEFVQCRACFFFWNMNVKEREGNNNNNNEKPEKPFFFSSCVCAHEARSVTVWRVLSAQTHCHFTVVIVMMMFIIIITVMIVETYVWRLLMSLFFFRLLFLLLFRRVSFSLSLGVCVCVCARDSLDAKCHAS